MPNDNTADVNTTNVFINNITSNGNASTEDNNSNSSNLIPSLYNISMEDSNWIMTSAFIIFTMQTGFGMLESGCVSIKNEVNIMMKNVVDIFLGGFTFWLFGYGLSFGNGEYTTPWLGVGEFALDVDARDPKMGPTYTAFLFQLSFATTATTIVSGAMAERCNFKAYCIFSFLNTIVYCVPAGWVWGEHGFLKNLGIVDIAGSGPVHLVGGTCSFASAIVLGPRLGRYLYGTAPLPLGTPVNCCLGLFVLWWGWLAFNSGSTYGVSGAKWQYAAKAAVMTMLSSFGGGFLALFYSILMNKGHPKIMDLINGVLGSLVAITAGCFLYHSWEAIFIGCIGGIIACITMPLIDKIGVDDPVGATSVHGICGIWGVIAVGLFAENPYPLETTSGRRGLFKGGGWYMLSIQVLGCFCLGVWSFLTTLLLLWIVNLIIPVRMNPHDELLGADFSEHGILHKGVGVSRALSKLDIYNEARKRASIQAIGTNPGHENYLQKYIQNHNHELEKIKAEDMKCYKLYSINENLKNDEKIYSRFVWLD
ncbi:putative ammonium transporter 2 [Lycorma delicatula]|uniref:putative ammonium transporter 2 n=1 Tax=Lycorma delicatula TaxID=130591 RepID=UPI003F516ECC